MKIYGPYIAPEEYEEAAKNGINKTNLEVRIRREGWDHKRAITQPIRKLKRHTWSVVAKENGINSNLYHSRISDGWDEERAATEPVHDSAKELGEYVKSKRKYSQEIIDLAASNGIKYTTFTARMRTGTMTELEAATTPVRTLSEAGKISAEKQKRVKGFNSYGAISQKGEYRSCQVDGN